jgi:hypothetical protein
MMTRLLEMRQLLLATQAQLKRAVAALEFLPEVCNILENPDWQQADLEQFTNEFYQGMSTWLALSKLPTPAVWAGLGKD